MVQEGIYDRFVEAVVSQCKQMRVGAALGDEFVDCGALCMPGHSKHVQVWLQRTNSSDSCVNLH